MRTGTAEKLSFRSMYIDFHTHILPEMDDGSGSADMSLQMIRCSLQQRCCCLLLTPHFYAFRDYPEHFFQKRDRQLRLLNEQRKAPVPLLIPGAEVHYFEGITSMRELPGMRIEKSPGILIEMPFGKWSGRMVDDILELNHRGGYQVILAHIERYISHQKEATIEKLVSEGVLMQANASFFTEKFTSKKAIRMLEDGLIHLLGSDCHNLTSRPPNLGDACRLIEEKCGPEMVKSIMDRGMRLLLADAPDTSRLQEELVL